MTPCRRMWFCTLVLVSSPCIAAQAAENTIYFHTDAWDAFSGRTEEGRSFCGIGHTNPADGRVFSLRFEVGTEDVVFRVVKPSWVIPAETKMKVILQIGPEPPWTEQAEGNEHTVQWTMDRMAIQTFDAQFRRGLSMTLSFPDGNEPRWTIPLAGSTAISNVFGRCITDLNRREGIAGPAPGGPTQPFGGGRGGATPASPPVQPAPTQPMAPR
jgi:hypothetical protein